MNTSTINLNNDLNKFKNWAIQLKMNFNSDSSKQVQEVIFSRKLQKTNHNQVYFNHNSVKEVRSQKHLGMYLDTKLNFQEHLNNVLTKANKTTGILRKLQAFLPHQSLATAYKAFIRPHLDYGNVNCDQAYNDSFHQKMESVQYNTPLATTGAIRGTSREKLYQKLGLESLRIENSATFSKYLKFNLRSISSEYFPALAKHIIKEVMVRFPSSVVNIIFL